MKNFDIIIIGGGASGCIVAITASKHNKKILLIDKANLVGKKLLVTGNGRCNITNANVFPSIKYYNQNIDRFLNILPPSKTLSLFEKMGLICRADSEGRFYPISNSAKSVVDVLNNKINKLKNVTLALNCVASDVLFEQNLYKVITDQGKFWGKVLVIASGGKSLENILNKFDVNVKPFTESLVALKTNQTKNLDGIRLSPVNVQVCGSSFQDRGEVLFKDKGLSGIVSFNISSYFARKGAFEGSIKLDLLPDYTENQIFKLIESHKKLDLPVNKVFDGIFLPQIAYFILNNCKIDENKSTLYLSDSEIANLTKTIKNITLKVQSHYENNQVFSGGVKLSSLKDNLECIKQKNLYFCGEICDVDGLCGGYNLQWAWTSGFIVGESIC